MRPGCSTVGPWSSMTSVLLERGNLNNYAHRVNAMWRLKLCCYKPMELVYVEWMCMFVSVCMNYAGNLDIILTEIRTGNSAGFLTATQGWVVLLPAALLCDSQCVVFSPIAAQALHLPGCRGLNKSKTCVLICAVKTILLRWPDSRTVKLHVKPQLCFWLPENAQHLGELL